MDRPRTEPIQVRGFVAGQEPEVEVCHEGRWFEGYLRSWFQYEDGEWWANVRFRTGVAENRLDTFHSTQVRPLPDPGEPLTMQ